MGLYAGQYLTTGTSNIGFGYTALGNVTSGAGNTIIGESAGAEITTAYSNVGVGAYALGACVTGSYNMSLGQNSLRLLTSGSNNVAIGYNALYAQTTSSNNTAVGYEAGVYITGGSTFNITSGTSVYIGRATKAYADGDANEIVIGYNATGAGSNTATLGNTSITSTVLRGTVNTDGSYQVDGVQVVSNRVIDARIDDVINSGDATTDGVIDALRDIIIAHGLGAAA